MRIPISVRVTWNIPMMGSGKFLVVLLGADVKLSRAA